MIAGRELGIGQQHPFAAIVGGDAADLLTVCRHADHRMGCRTAGDDHAAIGIDADDIETGYDGASARSGWRTGATRP